MGNLGEHRQHVPAARRRSDCDVQPGRPPEPRIRWILPGVGSFDKGMGNLKRLGLIPVLEERVLDDRVPILGIRLGMQLFCAGSEEGNLRRPRLDRVECPTLPGLTQNGNRLKIPHMGWNVGSKQKMILFSSGINGQDRFYFVHSYHIGEILDEQVIGTTRNSYDFPSVIRKENIHGDPVPPREEPPERPSAPQELHGIDLTCSGLASSPASSSRREDSSRQSTSRTHGTSVTRSMPSGSSTTRRQTSSPFLDIMASRKKG